MATTASYGSISGNSAKDYCFIAQRFDEDEGFKPDYGESWLYYSDGDEGRRLYGGAGWLTGVWYSPGQIAYVSDDNGDAIVYRDPPSMTEAGQKPKKGQLAKENLPVALFGVWGLDDRFVLTWGDDGEDGRVWRWDGKKWGELPRPPGRIMDIEGLAPDLVIAVGYHGMIARWDGRAWTQLASPTKAGLNAVAVVSPDEMYATSSSGVLLEGSIHGWAEALDEGIPLFGVAKFKGTLYVGAGDEGLYVRKGKKLAAFKKKIKARAMEARKDLLVVAGQEIGESTDGKAFMLTDQEFVVDDLQDKKPTWE